MSTISTDDPYIARVHALLEKAESTPYEAEAEAFLAKAQELMARHAIDEAMLASARTGPDDIVLEHTVIGAPYANAKSVLLGSVARANRCKAVIERSARGTVYCTVVGHRTDVEHVRLLFLALSYQAVRFMLEARVPPGDTTRRFRHSFLLAYAARIGERLQAIERATRQEAQDHQFQHPGGMSVALVMADRVAKVDRAVAESFGPLRTRSVSSSSRSGHQSGRSAADRASLNQPGLRGGNRSLPPG